MGVKVRLNRAPSRPGSMFFITIEIPLDAPPEIIAFEGVFYLPDRYDPTPLGDDEFVYREAIPHYIAPKSE